MGNNMLNDLISRQAAIDAFDGVKVDEENCTEYDIGYNDGIDFAVSKLSVLPSAQPEQRWIPCSERLPKVGQDILMSVGGMYTAEGCLREDGDWAQFRWDTIQRKDMVGAWMPLPEPPESEK